MKKTQKLNTIQQTLKCYSGGIVPLPKLAFLLCIGIIFLTNSTTAQQTVNFCPGDVVDLTAFESATGTYTYNDCSNTQVLTGDFLYVPSSSCTAVSIVDLSNNMLVTTFDGNLNGNTDLLVGSNGLIYATGINNNVTVVDPNNNHNVVATIPTGDVSMAIIEDPNSGYIYVTNSSSNDITVIDPVTNTVVTTVSLLTAPGQNPVSLIAANGLIYITAAAGVGSAGGVVIMDPSNNFSLTSLPLLPQNSPTDVVLAPNGNLYFSYNTIGGSGVVLVFDPNTNSVINTIPTGFNATSINLLIDANGYIYVHSLSTDIVYVIDSNTDMVIASPSGFSNNTAFILDNMAVGPNGLIYVTHNLLNASTSTISIIDPNNNFSVTHNVTTLQANATGYGQAIYSGTISSANPITNTTNYMPTVDGEQICVTRNAGCYEQTTITFALDPSCAPVCDLTDAGLVVGTCSDEGTTTDPNDDTFTFTLNPTGTDLGMTGYSFTDAGANYAGIGTYGAAVTFGPFLISAGAQTITITDMDDTNCTIDVLVTPPATCSSALPCAADVGTFPGRD